MYERTRGNIVLKNAGVLCCSLKCNSYIQMFLFLHRSYLGPGQGKSISCIGTLYYFLTTLSKSKYFPVKKFFAISLMFVLKFFSLYLFSIELNILIPFSSSDVCQTCDPCTYPQGKQYGDLNFDVMLCYVYGGRLKCS